MSKLISEDLLNFTTAIFSNNETYTNTILERRQNALQARQLIIYCSQHNIQNVQYFVNVKGIMEY